MSGIDMLEQRRNRAFNRVHTWLLAAGSLFLLAVTAWPSAVAPASSMRSSSAA